MGLFVSMKTFSERAEDRRSDIVLNETAFCSYIGNHKSAPLCLLHLQ